ncbi:MAG: tetratricopeptide repeat protein, partial [Phycisphaerae bacterium]
FSTTQEGRYGLFLVVHTALGASAPPPQAGTTPHAWAYVDATPPLVQIHSVEQVAPFEQTRRLIIHYNVYDAHLIDRPITVDYIRDDTVRFVPIAARRPNTGHFEWTVPHAIRGRITVRILAEDRGGNVAVGQTQPIDLPAPAAPSVTDASENDSLTASSKESPAPPLAAPDAPAAAEAMRPSPIRLAAAPLESSQPPQEADDDYDVSDALKIGDLRQARGEWAVAEQRFAEILDRAPGRTDIRNRLAAVLLEQGRLPAAEQAYREILLQSPTDPAALTGLALVLARRGDYVPARDLLLQLLDSRPNDPSVLLQLGDMQWLSGDSAAGRVTWRQAGASPDVPRDLLDRVQKRLLIYSANRLP